MSATHHERLSGSDLTFLVMEDGRAHMHIGMVAIFDAAPLRLEHGGLDIERIERYVESRLHQIPRLRQKVTWVPGIGQPVWVDDPDFNVHYHVRHTALPPPGDARQLKRVAARIMSQELDRNKPLWEHWFVDRVDGDHFALVSKLHHCMIDGVSGVETVRLLLSDDAEAPSLEELTEAIPDWSPRPAPRDASLLVDELLHRAAAPIGLVGKQLRRNPRGLASAAGRLTAPKRGEPPSGPPIGPSDSPLNLPIGPHRRFDWTSVRFDHVHDVGQVAGGTVNDVVLAVAAGALREYLAGRDVDVDHLDLKVMVPVDVRTSDDGAKMGNRVSAMIAPLPVDVADPWERLERMIEITTELKSSGQARVGNALAQFIELLPPRFIGPAMRRGSQASPHNLAITNVRGSREPMYFLGAKMSEWYGAVPLSGNQALGIALISYDDRLFWGFNADWDAIRDLHDLVERVDRGVKKLRKLARKRA